MIFLVTYTVKDSYIQKQFEEKVELLRRCCICEIYTQRNNEVL